MNRKRKLSRASDTLLAKLLGSAAKAIGAAASGARNKLHEKAMLNTHKALEERIIRLEGEVARLRTQVKRVKRVA